jgi:hypothetical protein
MDMVMVLGISIWGFAVLGVSFLILINDPENKVAYVGIILGLILAIGPSMIHLHYKELEETGRTELVKDYVFEEYGLKEEETITDVQSLGNSEYIYNIKTERGEIEVYVKDQKIIGSSESALDSN